MPLLAGQQCGIGRFGNHDAHLGSRTLQHLADAGQRATGPETGNEMIQSLSGEIAENLGCRRLTMKSRIGGVIELPGSKPTVFFRKLVCSAVSAAATLGARKKENLAAIGSYQLTPFNRITIAHHRHELIA